MSGFDNGTIQGGVFAQTQQLGAVLRGMGPPVPQAGVIGALYVDKSTWQLFNKRAPGSIDPWGHFLFVVPVTYRAGLKWFASDRPGVSVGTDGDYCLLWGGFANYGMQPSIYGPKVGGAWPANPVDVAVTINPLYASADQHNVNAPPPLPSFVESVTGMPTTLNVPLTFAYTAGEFAETLFMRADGEIDSITIAGVNLLPNFVPYTQVFTLPLEAGDTITINYQIFGAGGITIKKAVHPA